MVGAEVSVASLRYWQCGPEPGVDPFQNLVGPPKSDQNLGGPNVQLAIRLDNDANLSAAFSRSGANLHLALEFPACRSVGPRCGMLDFLLCLTLFREENTHATRHHSA